MQLRRKLCGLQSTTYQCVKWRSWTCFQFFGSHPGCWRRSFRRPDEEWNIGDRYRDCVCYWLEFCAPKAQKGKSPHRLTEHGRSTWRCRKLLHRPMGLAFRLLADRCPRYISFLSYADQAHGGSLTDCEVPHIPHQSSFYR